MIYANRTVRVGRDESTMDEPIILYRGDKEVEVEFRVLGNRYVFTDDEDLIESIHATHGQLVIARPDRDWMFSEVAPCENGRVTFVITKEMIDGLEEVGFYDFQIRLFDESQTSRVTLPPVYKGFDIRHPIGSEEETNVVDLGMVDYSVVRDDPFEDAFTFKPNGDYNKTIWNANELITAPRMNKIEDAIDTINTNMEVSDTSLFNRIEKVNNNLSARINSMADDISAEAMETVNAQLNDTIERIDTQLNNASETVKAYDGRLKDIEKKSYASVTDYGAVGDANYYNSSDGKYYVDARFITLATDSTSAFQSAIDANTSVKLPKGNYWVSQSLVIKNKELDFFGDGMNASKIRFTGSIDLFTTNMTLLRVGFRDFACEGVMDTTGSCFKFTSSCTLHRSEFRNLILYSGDTCVYCLYDFSCIYYNVHVWSRRGHGFELGARNSTTLIGCYAHQIEGVDKCGYRIYNYATLLGCNGLDKGETWAIFGQYDGGNTYSYISLIGCNFEDFSKQALVVNNASKINIIGCKFDGEPSTTYEHYILAPNSDLELTLIGNKDISKNKPTIAEIIAKNDFGKVFASSSDINTVKSNLRGMVTEYNHSGGKTSYVLDTNGIAYIAGRTLILDEGTVAFARIVDNNPAIGDELKVIVAGDGINFKHAVMGATNVQSIITKTGAHRIVTKGEIIKLVFNGTCWVEV